MPSQPSSLRETGLPASLLDDLILKILRTHDRLRVIDIADATALHPQVVADVLETLVRRQQAEIQAADSSLVLHFRYHLTEAGKAAADDRLRRCSYVGPAPVPVELYSAAVLRQARSRARPARRDVDEALAHLVLAEATVDALGQAFLSGRTLMVFGPSGNGKTDIVTSIAGCTAGSVLIPNALYAQGQIIEMFDPQVHETPTPGRNRDRQGPALEPVDRHDRRWREIQRPAVVIGGEIGATALEMTFDPGRNVHKAPLSVKAQGGVLVIDDLGRQRFPVESILDRWVQLMERNYDSFSLQYSEVVTLPMDVTLVFSTNLSLEELMDEAYLRRISYKIPVPNPDSEQLAEITRRCCAKAKLAYTDEAVRYLVSKLFNTHSLEPRGCYPRDIIHTIIDAGRYFDHTPKLNAHSIDSACELYFSYRQTPALRKVA
jgi:predicted ATPase with chaperone activity